MVSADRVGGRAALRAAAAALLPFAGLAAQFQNRAIWLGRAEEGIRRDFEQGREYFIDRLSYVDVAPWWERGLPRFGNELSYRLGSVTGSEFTIEGHADFRAELGDGVALRYGWLQSENRDTRFLRDVLELEYETGESTALFVQGTPLADKTAIDVSPGAWLWRRDDSGLRVMVTFVDAPSRQGDEVDYLESAFGLQIAGAFGDPESHRIAFDIGSQLPFELAVPVTGERFAMQRHIASASAQLRLGERDWLYGEVESEYADKELTPADPAALALERFDRVFHRLRLEYWRDGGTPWSVGFTHVYHSEDGRRPNDPANDLRTQRREWYGIARTQLRIDEKLAFEPQVLAGHARVFTADGTAFTDSSRFEGKLNLQARWDFSPNATLALLVCTQLDELAFGGGGCQFVARF